MHLFDGLSAREVGRKLGIDHKTVAKRAKDAVAAIVKASPKLGPEIYGVPKPRLALRKARQIRTSGTVEDRSERNAMM